MSQFVFPYPQWAARVHGNARLFRGLIAWAVGMAGSRSHLWFGAAALAAGLVTIWLRR